MLGEHRGRHCPARRAVMITCCAFVKLAKGGDASRRGTPANYAVGLSSKTSPRWRMLPCLLPRTGCTSDDALTRLESVVRAQVTAHSLLAAGTSPEERIPHRSLGCSRAHRVLFLLRCTSFPGVVPWLRNHVITPVGAGSPGIVWAKPGPYLSPAPARSRLPLGGIPVSPSLSGPLLTRAAISCTPPSKSPCCEAPWDPSIGLRV